MSGGGHLGSDHQHAAVSRHATAVHDVSRSSSHTFLHRTTATDAQCRDARQWSDHQRAVVSRRAQQSMMSQGHPLTHLQSYIGPPRQMQSAGMPGNGQGNTMAQRPMVPPDERAGGRRGADADGSGGTVWRAWGGDNSNTAELRSAYCLYK